MIHQFCTHQNGSYKTLKKTVLRIFWSKQKTHISKDIIIKEITEGGLKMPLFSGMLRGIKVLGSEYFK